MAHAMKRYHRRGVTTLEAALIFPVLLLLTFGAIEYGWLLLKSQQTTNAARHGARVAILVDADNTQVLSEIATLMDSAGMGTSGYTVHFTPADVTTAGRGEPVTVEVEVPYSDGVELMGIPLIPVPSHIQAATCMAKEGP
jgi:Flp pilus assembly protein TadG